MHSLAYQQNTKLSVPPMIYQNRREPDSKALNIDGIRAAVRAWAADCRSREFVAALIVEEWRATGGTGLDIPTDSHRQMQKVFRWIDGDTEYAANNIRQLAPAIMSVLPLEYRNRLAPQNDTMSLIASAMKECAEAKQAVLLNAPEHQKLKEVSEGIASLIASAMKECAEAKQAVLLNAPEHQKLKEVSEGIASLFRLMPEQVGPLMTMVTSMLGVM